MRTASIRIRAKQKWFGPLDRVLTDDADVTRAAIHNIRHLGDESLLALYEYTGPVDRLGDRLEDYFASDSVESAPEVIGWQLASEEGSLYVYQHHRPTADITRQFDLLDEHRLLIDPPIRFTENDDLRVTLIGPESQFSTAYETSSRDMRLTLDRIGNYGSHADELLAELTEREREILHTAVILGYFENPRGANYDDIATEFGCSKATVGQHIRDIQAKLTRQLFPDQYEQEPQHLL